MSENILRTKTDKKILNDLINEYISWAIMLDVLHILFLWILSIPMRLVSFEPFYRRGDHGRYKLNDLPTTCPQQLWRCFFSFGALVSPVPKSCSFFVVLFCGIVLEKRGTVKIIVVIKSSCHLAYSRHYDQYFEYITTRNSPNHLMKKVLLFPVMWKETK